MLFNLHNDYVKAAAPRPGATARHVAELDRGKAPPRRMRARVALALAVTARRVDGESARRALAS